MKDETVDKNEKKTIRNADAENASKSARGGSEADLFSDAAPNKASGVSRGARRVSAAPARQRVKPASVLAAAGANVPGSSTKPAAAGMEQSAAKPESVPSGDVGQKPVVKQDSAVKPESDAKQEPTASEDIGRKPAAGQESPAKPESAARESARPEPTRAEPDVRPGSEKIPAPSAEVISVSGVETLSKSPRSAKSQSRSASSVGATAADVRIKMMSDLLRVENIRADINDRHVLRGVSLTVRPKEIITVAGSQGVGKTTALKVIRGQEKHTAGQILFRGESIGRFSAEIRVRKGLNMMPDRRRFHATMTVSECLILGGYTLGNRDLVDEKIDFCLETFPELKDKLSVLGSNLEVEEQLMLGISRAMMSDPVLVMLDDPCAGLIAKKSDAIFERIRKLADGGMSFLVAEQGLSSALKFSDRAYVLSGGMVVLTGTGKEVSSTKEFSL